MLEVMITGFTSTKLQNIATKPSRTTKDVATIFKTNMTETQRENRTSLLKIISCLCYLACQGLPFRGHGYEKDANFKEHIRFRAEDDPAFAKWLKEKSLSYTSPEIQNEILKDIDDQPFVMLPTI